MERTNHPPAPTEAQINANRENAKKSTGPRTTAGKEASSRNGLKHGLCAGKHLLPGEDPEDFLALVNDLLNTFRPVGEGEEKLVLRIAADQWRLDRVFPMEAGIFRDRFHDVATKEKYRQKRYATEKQEAAQDGDPAPPPPTPPDEGDLLARAFNADCAGPNSFTKLARYESAIERSIDRCLRQLKAFQAARNASGRADGPVDNSPEVHETKDETAPEPAAAPSQMENCEAKPKNGGSRPRPNGSRRTNSGNPLEKTPQSGPQQTERPTRRGNSAKITASRRHEPRNPTDER